MKNKLNLDLMCDFFSQPWPNTPTRGRGLTSLPHWHLSLIWPPVEQTKLSRKNTYELLTRWVLISKFLIFRSLIRKFYHFTKLFFSGYGKLKMSVYDWTFCMSWSRSPRHFWPRCWTGQVLILRAAWPSGWWKYCVAPHSVLSLLRLLHPRKEARKRRNSPWFFKNWSLRTPLFQGTSFHKAPRITLLMY